VQRVRIGLTGLAFVFILVLLGAIFASPTAEDSAANVVERQLTPGNRGGAGEAAANAALPREPLAELGVAPGNADQNDAGAGSGAAAPPGR
jgi:hypothetical protein